MALIDDILNADSSAAQKISALKEKTINVPLWRGSKGLEWEFNPDKHPVMNKAYDRTYLRYSCQASLQTRK